MPSPAWPRPSIPPANARYAAALLNRLHEQAGNWPSAIALYHSADPFEGQRYGSRVIEVQNGGISVAAAPAIEIDRPARAAVIRLAAAAFAVRVVVPDWTIVRSPGTVYRCVSQACRG